MYHRRGSGERGATLIESAIITPLLMMFVFGIFEFGFAFRDYLTVANAARDGVREASVAGNTGDADYRMLRAVQRASAALPDGGLDYVVVFKASGPDGVPTSTCAGGTAVANVCNVYPPSAMLLDITQFGCLEIANGDAIDSLDRYWCPYDREVSTGSGLDYVGVYVKTEHQYITGMFGSSVTFEDQMILKVEPQSQ